MKKSFLSLLIICGFTCHSQKTHCHELSLNISADWYTNSFRFPYYYDPNDASASTALYKIPFKINPSFSVSYKIPITDWLLTGFQASFGNFNYDVTFPDTIFGKNGGAIVSGLESFSYKSSFYSIGVLLNLRQKKWQQKRRYASIDIIGTYGFIENINYKYSYRVYNAVINTEYKTEDVFWSVSINPSVNWRMKKKSTVSLGVSASYLGWQSLLKSEVFHMLPGSLPFQQKALSWKTSINIGYTFNFSGKRRR